MSFDVPPEMAGGVKGSFPLDGEYSKYEYPNWAAKFLVDSLMLETDISGASPSRILQSALDCTSKRSKRDAGPSALAGLP